MKATSHFSETHKDVKSFVHLLYSFETFLYNLLIEICLLLFIISSHSLFPVMEISIPGRRLVES